MCKKLFASKCNLLGLAEINSSITNKSDDEDVHCDNEFYQIFIESKNPNFDKFELSDIVGDKTNKKKQFSQCSSFVIFRLQK